MLQSDAHEVDEEQRTIGKRTSMLMTAIIRTNYDCSGYYK